MTSLHTKSFCAVATLLCTVLLCHATPVRATQPALPSPQAPVLHLPDLAGVQHDLGQWRGRPVLLNYWASWCGPCLKELPELQGFSRAQAARPGGIQLVGIAQDEARPVAALVKRLALTYPQLVEAAGPPGSAAALGNPDGTLPFSVLIDAHGKIIKTHNGPLDAAELARWAALVEAPR